MCVIMFEIKIKKPKKIRDDAILENSYVAVYVGLRNVT